MSTGFDYREIAEILGDCDAPSAFTAVRLTFLKSIAKIVKHIMSKSQGIELTEKESLILANSPYVQDHISDILHSMTISMSKKRNVRSGDSNVEAS
jgi:hypothetical protein